MKREILFRGKRLDNGEWVEGAFYKQLEFYGDPCENCVIITTTEDLGYDQALDYYDVDPETVGQYTGMQDKNDTKIFEGDIVRFVSLLNDHHQKGATHILQVRFFMGNMCLCFPGFDTGTPIYPVCVGKEIEVIGNRWDNPELLEVTE